MTARDGGLGAQTWAGDVEGISMETTAEIPRGISTKGKLRNQDSWARRNQEAKGTIREAGKVGAERVAHSVKVGGGQLTYIN